MIKILLFDVDGVLVNGGHFGTHLERDYGITAEQLTPFFHNEFQRCLVGAADLKEVLQPYLAQWGWQQSTTAFLDYWFTCEHVLDQSLLTYVQQVRAQGLHCYLATQQEQYRTQYIAQEMELANMFDGIFSSANLHYLKSEPAFFHAILRSLPDVHPSEVLFWDDSPNNVAVAQAAELHAEHYTDFPAFIQTMKTYELIK